MIPVVLDTNVLVSAMISANGNEALVLLAVHQSLIEPCFSLEILNEYSSVLIRPKFGFARAEVDALLALFRSRGRNLGSVPVARVSPDPGDDKFIACALLGKAHFLVTGNKKHFPMDKLGDVRVVSAGELLEFVMLEM
jgi:uncharacterized protein